MILNIEIQQQNTCEILNCITNDCTDIFMLFSKELTTSSLRMTLCRGEPQTRHLYWVRDFDFMLNLFSLPSPCLLPVPETDSLPSTPVVSSEPFTCKQLRKSKSCSRNYTTKIRALYIQSGPKIYILSLLINIFGINLNEISISGWECNIMFSQQMAQALL